LTALAFLLTVTASPCPTDASNWQGRLLAMTTHNAAANAHM